MKLKNIFGINGKNIYKLLIVIGVINETIKKDEI